MKSQKPVKKNTFGWCLGCGLFNIFNTTQETLNELNPKNTIIISGIGCTGRASSYFNFESVYGIHGRAIPLAVGVKIANPKLNVIVFSGDGDILGIGGNHLIHSIRRNDNITVICNNNSVYGMTGGQLSPTTNKGGKTLTTPKGSNIQPINTQGILLSNENYFYARSSPIFKKHLKKCITEGINHVGFSFIEVISPCITNYSKRMGQSPKDVLMDIKQRYKISEKNKPLKNNELGIVKK